MGLDKSRPVRLTAEMKWQGSFVDGNKSWWFLFPDAL